MTEYGPWVELFNGKDLRGWKFTQSSAGNAWVAASKAVMDPADSTKLAITPGAGLVVNGPVGRTCDIYTEMEHGDCELHVEFMVPKGSNSGVYFQGRYEVQILDSYGKKDVKHDDCGGIYARWINNAPVDGHPPRVNASKPPGEWQTYDVLFQAPRFNAAGQKVENARFIQVVHNGTVIHEDLELKGPTRAAMWETEAPTGPLMLQGDHGPVAYRNVRMRSLRTSASSSGG